ncbi:MAG: ATP-binding protein [Deferribacterales bacterium]
MSVAVFILIFSTYSKLRSDIISKNEEAFNMFGKIFETEQETMIRQFSLGLDTLTDNQTLVERFARRDREGLAKLVDNIYDTRLKHLYDIDQFQFHIPPAISFYRVHSKENYGDSLETIRRTVVKANQQKTMVAGIEMGRSGLGLRVVKPVWYNFDSVGTVEFGGSIEHILRTTKTCTDIEYATAIYKKNAEKVKFFHDSSSWLRHDDLLVYDFSSDETRKIVTSGLMEKKDITRFDGKFYMTYKMPLYDYSANQIGWLFLAKDTSKEVTQMYSALTKQAAAIIAYGLFALALVSGFMIKVIFRPIENIARHVTDNEITIEKEPKLLSFNENTEITVLAEAFNNLSMKLYSNLWQQSRQIHAIEDINKNLENTISNRTKQLEDANQRLESALDNYRYINEVKTEFLTAMSHEIRTPMNAIIGLSYLALQTGLNSKQYEYVSKIHSSATFLMEIINDILDYSKIEAGKLELENISFNIIDLLKSIKDILEVQAEKKKIILKLDISDEVPAYVKGDPTRLMQVLSNIGSNAVKFTDKGSVVISVDCTESNMAYSTIRFTVKDTGIGIPADKINKIFSSYEQISKKTSRKYGGSGLGLSICKKILDKMGSSVFVESEQGKGSTFSFTLKMKNTDVTSTEELKERSSILKNKRILVSENMPSEQGSISSIFRELQADVVSVDSNIELMKTLGSNIKSDGTVGFDLLVLENRMHDDSPLGVFEKLDTDPGLLPPVIYISSEHPQKDIGLKISTLAKPASPTLLFHSAVTAVTGEQSKDELPEILNAKETGHKIHVLVADDNSLNREVASEFMQLLGISVSFAENGREAVEAAEKEIFDAIFLDIMMPELDGYSAARTIREGALNADTPIYAMTASVIDEDKLKMKTALITGAIGKPLKINEISRAVTEAVRISSARTAGSQMYDSGGHVDFMTGLGGFGGNEALFIKALQEFLKTADGIRKEMTANPDTGTLSDIFRSVGSYAENLAMPKLSQTAKNAESALAANNVKNTIESVTLLLEELNRVVKIVSENLRNKV